MMNHPVKINANANVEQTGNVDTSMAVQFGFDVSGMGAIAGLLQNMYCDAWLAVLREYFWQRRRLARRRRDHPPGGSHTVTLPSDLNSSLIIQNFGPGLSLSANR